MKRIGTLGTAALAAVLALALPGASRAQDAPLVTEFTAAGIPVRPCVRRIVPCPTPRGSSSSEKVSVGRVVVAWPVAPFAGTAVAIVGATVSVAATESVKLCWSWFSAAGRRVGANALPPIDFSATGMSRT